MSAHMGRERELLAKRRMLEQEAHKKYDELDKIFQQVIGTDAWQNAHKKFDELDEISKQVTETNKKIEEQREKQQHHQTEWGSEGERCGKER